MSSSGRRLSENDSRHGTYTGYQNWGCRCERCRQANTDYYRVQRHIRGVHRPRSEEAALRHEQALARNLHGTPQRYWIGCRCRSCKTAEAAYQRGRREARKVA